MGNCCFNKREKKGYIGRQPGVLEYNGPDAKSVASTSKVAMSTNQKLPPTIVITAKIVTVPQLKVFTLDELRCATKNFSVDKLIGIGGFGHVYRGIIPEGSDPNIGAEVAVKKMITGGFQGRTEWEAEIRYLSMLHHPNVVKLIGYCFEDSEYLLVYEFIKNGNLENLLFGRFNPKILSLNKRLQIALGIARGLAYLHSQDPKVIHRDLKSSNVLLDSDYNPKLSDFGMARDGPTGDRTHVSTRVIGTYGYAPPDYIETGHLRVNADVYSFGVVLLELLTGRNALDGRRPRDEQSLVHWATHYLHGTKKVLDIIDERLQGQYPRRSAFSASMIAMKCVGKNRPNIVVVVETLEKLVNGRGEASSMCPDERR